MTNETSDDHREATDEEIAEFVESLSGISDAEKASFVRAAFREHLAAARKGKGPMGLGQLYLGMGSMLDDLALYDEAESTLERGVKASKKEGDEESHAGCLLCLAVVSQNRGQIQEALRLCGETIEVSTAAGYKRGQAQGMAQLSVLLAQVGQRGEAIGGLVAAAEIFEEIGDEVNQARCLRHLRGLGV